MTKRVKSLDEFRMEQVKVASNEDLFELDSFLANLKEELSKERPMSVNLKRFEEAKSAYMGIKKAVLSENEDAKVNFEIDKLTRRNAYIIIEADEIIVRNISEFMDNIKGAANFEIYPLNTRELRMIIAFFDVITEK